MKVQTNVKQVTQAVLVLLLSVGVHTQRPETARPEGPQQPINDALDGLDPVLLVQGNEILGKSAFSVVRGGFTYLFSAADTKATFERDPATYEIQLGGVCARMGKTAGGNPSDFIVHGGRIYIFGSDECHKRFQAAPEKYLPPRNTALPDSKHAANRGRQLLDRAVSAVGAAQRLDGLTTYVESFTQVQKRPQGDVPVSTKTMWRFPDHVRQERTMTLQDKTMSSATVLSPQGLWFLAGQGQVYPMIAAGRPSLERDFGRHPVSLLRARGRAGFKAVALGTATVEGISVQQVRVVNGPLDATLNLDPKGRIHSLAFLDRNSEGEYGTYMVRYSDFRVIEGLTLPFTVRAFFNGQPDAAQTWKVESIAPNVPLDPSLFAPRTGVGK